jgi:hypothetical protein
MDSSQYIISDVIPIPQHIEVRKLVGNNECNLKSISERTRTLVCVNRTTHPAKIEIKYNANFPPPHFNIINEVKDQVNKLIEEEGRRVRLEKKKEGHVSFLNDFGDGKITRYQREIIAKKEKQKFKREIHKMINTYEKNGIMEDEWEREVKDELEKEHYYY